MTTTARPPVGALLREWRERRRLSQLELSIQANVSTRHLSFVETGRSRPTPEMIVRLTEHLDVPLRERNEVLLAGGYAPAYPEHGLDEPALASVRRALRQVLDRHAPYPAIVLNRWWELVDANAAVATLTRDVAAHLLEPPVNVLRLSLHPDGLASRIGNLAEWRAYLLGRLHQRAEATGDAKLAALEDELRTYPGATAASAPHDVVLQMHVRIGDDELSLFSIEAHVGTASDITVAELSIETFYPADERTAKLLQNAP